MTWRCLYHKALHDDEKTSMRRRAVLRRARHCLRRHSHTWHSEAAVAAAAAREIVALKEETLLRTISNDACLICGASPGASIICLSLLLLTITSVRVCACTCSTDTPRLFALGHKKQQNPACVRSEMLAMQSRQTYWIFWHNTDGPAPRKVAMCKDSKSNWWHCVNATRIEVGSLLPVVLQALANNLQHETFAS